MNHLFGWCSYFRNILEELGLYFQEDSCWDKEHLVYNFTVWYTTVKHLRNLQLFVMWECWKDRNGVIFEELHCSSSMVVSRIIGDYSA